MLSLNRQSDEPLYQQISRVLADRIRSGLLRHGEQLPTVRDLAAELHVSPVTVTQAYAALEAAGLADRQQGRGVYVRGRAGEGAPPGGVSRSTAHAWQAALQDYVPRSTAWGLLPRNLPPDVIQMQTAVVGANLLPIAELVQDLKLTMAHDPQLLGAYSPVAGLPRLKRAAADYLAGAGLQLLPDELMITQGAQQGIDLVARTFVGPGDGVAVESPTYPPAVDAFRARGAQIYPIPVDEEGMQVEALTDLRNLRVVYVVPTFQNPTGRVMSRLRRQMLLEIARERNLLIVEDDPWREITFGPAPPPPLKAQDQRGHVIYLKSFGKLVSVALRVGALAASGPVFERLLAAKGLADQGTALFPQAALQALLDSPRMDRHVRRLAAALQERRDLLLRTLESRAPRGVRWTTPPGGLSIWVQLPSGWNAEELLAPAIQRGVCFAPGHAFFPGAVSSNYLRLSYSLGSKEAIFRGACLLCDLLHEYQD